MKSSRLHHLLAQKRLLEIERDIREEREPVAEAKRQEDSSKTDNNQLRRAAVELERTNQDWTCKPIGNSRPIERLRRPLRSQFHLKSTLRAKAIRSSRRSTTWLRQRSEGPQTRQRFRGSIPSCRQLSRPRMPPWSLRIPLLRRSRPWSLSRKNLTTKPSMRSPRKRRLLQLESD